MSMAAFVAAMLFAGHQGSEWLWRRFGRAPLSTLERVCSSALLGIVLWLAVTWALALTFQLRPGPLLGSAVAAVAAGFLLRRKTQDPGAPGSGNRAFPRAVWLLLLPVAAWTLFLLWRGYVLPPHTPDALTYHLPRAAFIAKAGGFQRFEVPDHRINSLPANYELLLADFLVLEGSDTYTEWLNTLFFVLFLLQTGALAVRWWGPGLHAVATVLLMAGAPVLLLQGAAHKNDLMASGLLLAALLWLGRFFSERELASAFLVTLAACAAAGTKPHGLLFAALAAPIVLWLAWRAPSFRARHYAVAAGVAVAGFLLLGGWHYVDSLAPSPGKLPASPLGAVMPVGYGDWGKLWQTPLLILLAPFAASDEAVWVPWLDQEWLWERYDVHASNFGAAVSILAFALPFLAWRYRREPHAAGLHERLLVTGLAVLLALAVLPARIWPQGYVSGFPRYLLFLPPLVLCLTASPLLAAIERGGRSLLVALALAASAALFIDTAIDVARTDKFATARDFAWVEKHPGARWLPSMPRRAASVLDCFAGPGDSIDFHAGHDSWIYPAFGAELKRDLRFIRHAADIRPEAQWVAVDRAFNVIWKHPDFKDISEASKYLGRGIATREDREVVEALLDDPSYELEYYNQREVQAVFRRLPVPAAATPRERLDPWAFDALDLGACPPRKR